VNLWETLLRPDKEEREKSDRRTISDAANLLEVGEFQLLQLAYRDWHGEDLPTAQFDRLFDSFMVDGVAPPWARHYARKIVQEERLGQLDGQQRGYHRYDCEYSGKTALDFRGICLALGLAAFMVVGGIAISNFEADTSMYLFPPYVSDSELAPRSSI
jgi:hypothetical protein